jgi:signal transduction histidine kinase
MFHRRMPQRRLWSHGPPMDGSLKRIALIGALATLIAGGVIGLGLQIDSSQSATRSEHRSDVVKQTALAASLIGAAAIDGSRTPATQATIGRELRDVARSACAPGRTSLFLVGPGNGVIAAASGGGAAPSRTDPALLAAISAPARSGLGGGRFFAAAPVTGTRWRVVYTIAAAALGGGDGTLALPLLLLGAFGAAAVVCLLLLIRLQHSSEQLARANAALELRNHTVERATEAKTRFVANMSHELRTPLNAVIGFAELMHDGRAGEVSKRQREFLGIIRASANHLLRLINEVLDLSRIEAGQISLEPEAVDPTLIAAECVSSLRWLADEKRVRIDFDSVALGAASLDPARLRQVILNYLSNAIKFTATGGRVRVALARERDELLIEVSDTGIGISEEHRGRVFEEFVQVSDTAHGGSGLGLAVTKQIVEAQGGEVGVVSELGRGSSFYARLPWVEVDPAEAAIAAGRARVRDLRAPTPELFGIRREVRDPATAERPYPLAPPAVRRRRFGREPRPVSGVERAAEAIGAGG